MLFVAAGLALSLTGCRAFQPDPCRESGPNLFQRVGRWITHRDKAPRGPSFFRADDCEPGLIGLPAADDCGVIGGGEPVITAPTDGIIGADAPPLDLSPSLTNPPPAGSAPNPTGSLQPSNGRSSLEPAKPNKAVYESYRPSREPATALRDPAPASSARSSPAPDPLADLPKLDLPADLNPVPLEAEKVPDPAPVSAEASLHPVPDAATSSAPGIRSFAVVEPRLAGGSLPSDRGWQWLAEQGYRTVLDLRPLDQLRSEDLAAINSSGLRYVALPTSERQIQDPAHLARFTAEINQDAARPLFFFDRDGSRAAVLWYLFQVVHRRVPLDQAARVASEIGPRDPSLWDQAARVLEQIKPSNPPAVDPTTDPGPVPEPRPQPSPSSTPPTPASTPTPQPASVSTSPTPADPTSWKPYASLAAAGLGVPLAFLGRGLIARAIPRASLPAPPPSAPAIPASLDG
jgi:protein tyrosine phosphatase (PTP) superfamily phosphohydrolase (DUF442 family)